MDNVERLHPVAVGGGFRFDPDHILEAAKGKDFQCLAVLAQNPDGSLWVSGNASAGEIMVLMEKAKRLVVFGEDS